jgi:zinc transporter ZupT
MDGAGIPVLVATAVAWAGALAASLVRQAAGRIMRPLVYLALLFLGLAALLDILPESKHTLSWPALAAAVAGGYGAFWLIGKYVAPVCPACALGAYEREHRRLHGGGLFIVALVLGLHCVLDGFAVSAASAVQASFGLRVFGAIALHKLPEGVALVVVMTTGDRSVWRTCALAFGIEALTVAGALAGMLGLHPSEFWLALALAHIGGSFLYLSLSGLQDALSSRMAAAVSASF